ncbi:hypothetical protein INR49_017985 [Caranx melampygus]|nr:hypothetical protein INR49_017985 [Caranx melampygus]
MLLQREDSDPDEEVLVTRKKKEKFTANRISPLNYVTPVIQSDTNVANANRLAANPVREQSLASLAEVMSPGRVL